MSVDLVVEKCKQPQKNNLLNFEDEWVSNHSSLGYVNEQVMQNNKDRTKEVKM